MTSAENMSYADARTVMVDRHIRPADVTRLDVIEALQDTAREAFFPKSKRSFAYVGDTVEIAPGRFELDPRVFAKMLETLALEREDLVLVVGAGGGYAAAVTSRLSETVVALECDAELASAAEAALARTEAEAVIPATGPLAEGWAEHQPYNAILVYGGVEGDFPKALVDQLAEGGRIVAISMDGPIGQCVRGVKVGGALGAAPVFDAVAPVLPGMGRAKGFEF